MIQCKLALKTEDISIAINCDYVYNRSTEHLCTYAMMKTTPYELVFGQPPQSSIFPGAKGLVMEEDMSELMQEGV